MVEIIFRVIAKSRNPKYATLQTHHISFDTHSGHVRRGERVGVAASAHCCILKIQSFQTLLESAPTVIASIRRNGSCKHLQTWTAGVGDCLASISASRSRRQNFVGSAQSGLCPCCKYRGSLCWRSEWHKCEVSACQSAQKCARMLCGHYGYHR